MADQLMATFNGSFNDVNGESLDKRIESIIDELSDLLQKSGSKVDELKEVVNTESRNELDVKPLLTRMEAIAEMLEREDSDLYFEALYPLILNSKLILNSIFWSNETKRNSSELTSVNVKLNSIWETICYKIEKLIMNDMIRNNLESELDLEMISTHLTFLSQLKDTESAKKCGQRGSDLWSLFDIIRICRLEAQDIELYERTFDSFLRRIVFVVNSEVRLFKSGHFGAYGLTYRELVLPYMESVKSRLESEVSVLNTNVEELVTLLKIIIQFDYDMQQIREEMPRIMESPEVEQLFEWKPFLELNLNINSFNKIIYKEITSDLRDLQCFASNSLADCRPFADHNVFGCVWRVFRNFDDYQYLCVLDPMSTFLSYAISANILDFFVHHFNSGKYESIEQKYTLLNSVHYIMNRLQNLDISSEKFVAIAETAAKELKARHVSVVLMASNVRYSVLYLNRLWFELQFKLNHFPERSSIFEFVLSETIHHFSGTALESSEILYLMDNTIDLLIKNSYSLKEFLFDSRHNIHNSVWILFIKMIVKISNNEEFLTNLKTCNDSPDMNSDSSDHWIRYIRPKLMDNSFWLSARLCADKPYDKRLSKLIIRAFLSKSCDFCSFVLSNIDHNFDNEYCVSTAKDIFELILLQNFRPNLLSTVLAKLMERESNWSEFDKSTLSGAGPRVWWYRALENVITPQIDVILLKNLKSLINESIISSLITQEIDDLYKSSEVMFGDNRESEELHVIYALLNDIIHTLPISLVASLESLTTSAPEYVDPIAGSITLNVLISLVLKRLQNCSFLVATDIEAKQVSEFCQNLSSRFAESLTEEKYLLRIKRSIEWRKLEKIDSLNNEELEFDIIDSAIDFDNKSFDETLRRLHSILIKFKEVIDKNVGQRCDHSFDVILNKQFGFKYFPNTEDSDYKRILDSIDWKSLENQIKLKFDYSSRLALIV